MCALGKGCALIAVACKCWDARCASVKYKTLTPTDILGVAALLEHERYARLRTLRSEGVPHHTGSTRPIREYR